jgi:ribosome biogenesis GTPase
VRAAQANFYRVRIDPSLAALFPEIPAQFPAQKPTPAEILCTCRAKLKKTGQQVMVGDWVEVRLPPVAAALWPERGVIGAILPRRTQLPRPAIANATQVLVVVALAEPDPEPTPSAVCWYKQRPANCGFRWCSTNATAWIQKWR